jgi:hypothetical protein
VAVADTLQEKMVLDYKVQVAVVVLANIQLLEKAVDQAL